MRKGNAEGEERVEKAPSAPAGKGVGEIHVAETSHWVVVIEEVVGPQLNRVAIGVYAETQIHISVGRNDALIR